MPGWALGVAALTVPALFWVCRFLHWPFWWAGVVLIALAFQRRSAPLPSAWIGVGAALLGASALLARSDLPVRFYPVLVNAVLLGAFGWSLWRPPSLVERMARVANPELPRAAVAYTRRVTQAWCAFFLGNGAIALWTAVAADPRVWAVYNGGIAYALIGLMFGGEFLIRRVVMRRHGEP